MSKFKVGDRVKSQYGCGVVAQISKIEGETLCKVQYGNTAVWHDERMIYACANQDFLGELSELLKKHKAKISAAQDLSIVVNGEFLRYRGECITSENTFDYDGMAR